MGGLKWLTHGRSLRAVIVLAAVLAAAGAAASSAVDGSSRTHGVTPTRYSLVHGCYVIYSGAGRAHPIAPKAGPFRMQPAALAVYLLYGRHKQYVTDRGGGKIGTASTPSRASEWRVGGTARRGFTLTNIATKAKRPVTFVEATRCAKYPEAEVDASGRPFTGASPGSTVRGTMEGHAHITAFELLGGDWHCGRPWHPFGAPYALPADCSPYEVGANGAVESFLDFGGPTRPSDMHGWPTFREWPGPTRLAEEGDYYTGVERAWKAGLRVFVTDLVDNEALCSVMTKKHNPCNDMSSVHIQSRDLHALQDYIDAQSGGPGRGWFRIVKDPFQARRVINQGKLAVVEGIEVSRLFGCGEMYDVPQCGEKQVDAGLKEVRRLDVRTFFPVHEFDNAFGGTKMIAGETGTIVNAGNRDETGSFWTIHHCSGRVQDAQQVTPPPATGALADLINGPLASLLHGSPLPVYPPAPHCNVRGLTNLGAYLIRQMAKQHMIIQTDHMSSKTADAAIAIAARQHYAGVVSAHCCSSPQLFQRIYATGGYVNPPVGPGTAFVGKWKADKAVRTRRYSFGFGWGSDMNGLADQPGPTAPPIKYPFKSFDGHVKFSREKWGVRTFDYNKEGLANYGLYADWLEQVRRSGGRATLTDMFRGAESFLEMWERAYGVPATHCSRTGQHFTAAGLGHAFRLGAGRAATLYRAGQPFARPGRSYRYCVAGRNRAIVPLFNARGRVALIATNAPGDLAGGIGPGSAASGLGGQASQLGGGVWVGRSLRRGARYVYVVSGGRVRFVALATAAELRSPARLRADLRAAHL